MAGSPSTQCRLSFGRTGTPMEPGSGPTPARRTRRPQRRQPHQRLGCPYRGARQSLRHRLRLMHMMTSLAQEKGVQSLYGELTPSMREELGQIHKIEVEAGTAPPGPEPPLSRAYASATRSQAAIAAATTTAPTTAQPLPTPAGPWRARLVPRPRPLRTASLKQSRTLKPRQNDSRNHPPAAAPAEPAIAPASPEPAVGRAAAATLEPPPSPAPVQQTVPSTDNRTVEELKQRTREIIDLLGSPLGIGKTVARS